MSEQIKVDDPFLGPDISSSPPVNRILEVTNGFHLCTFALNSLGKSLTLFPKLQKTWNVCGYVTKDSHVFCLIF